MKVLINTLEAHEIWSIQQAQRNADVAEENLFNGYPEIDGIIFIPGQWTPVGDDFVLDTDVYPYIKEPSVVLEEKIQKVLQDYGLIAFAQGVEQVANDQSVTIPTIVSTVQSVPIKDRSEIITDIDSVAVSMASLKGIDISSKLGKGKIVGP